MPSSVEKVEYRVVWAGPTRGALIGTMLASPGDSEGLILGDVIETVSTSVSDNDTNSLTRQIKLIPSLFVREKSFYGASGKLEVPVLKRLGQRFEGLKIIGWWKTRNSSPLIPSIRDLVVAEWMSIYIRKAAGKNPPTDGSNPSAGVALMCMSKCDMKMRNTMHSFTTKFWVRTKEELVPVIATTPSMGENPRKDYLAFEAMSNSKTQSHSTPRTSANGPENKISLTLKGSSKKRKRPYVEAEHVLKDVLSDIDTCIEFLSHSSSVRCNS
mmetsp:Transcript_26112/g.41326  ORF Transcript_26112/g.41326 Transcript_26112/m.41326 type:complete len:270 (-) Transcript_26112:107-916(-)